MNRTVIAITRLVAIAALAGAAAGCEAEKSRNPLSPNVAGPIAGVAITAPAPVSPINGAAVVNNTPVRLVFNNATSNGERPFWYVVEVATDTGFANKPFTAGRVAPAEGGQTTVVVETSLLPERTYYWRVKADDGANASEFSATATFDLVVPVAIDPPVPVSPVGGATAASISPVLTVNNGRVAGRPGRVDYIFQIATDAGFGNIVASPRTERSGGSTTSVQAPELPAGSLLYWRVIGTNGSVTSAPSAVANFRTPAGGGDGGGGGGGGGGTPPSCPIAGGRAPEPPPGVRLPLPNMSATVRWVAQQHPNALRNSCQDRGGSWEFMNRVVDELRKCDTRWGYNWKRGNVGDPSKDVVDYHWGRGADEGSIEVYIIDVITGHCGSNPSAGWGDVTDVTFNSGTIGRWTGRGRF